MPLSTKLSVMNTSGSSTTAYRSSFPRRLSPLKQQQQQQQHLMQNNPTIMTNGGHPITSGGHPLANGGSFGVVGVVTSDKNNNNGNGRSGVHLKVNNVVPPYFHNVSASGVGFLSITATPASHVVASPSETSVVAVSRLVGRKASPRTRQRVKLPSTRPAPQNTGTDFNYPSDLSPEVVTQYLKQNPEVLDHYITDHVKTDRIERWLQTKPLPSQSRHILTGHQSPALSVNGEYPEEKRVALSKWKTRLQTSKGRVLQELSKEFHHTNGKVMVLLELSACVASAITSDSYSLYSCDLEKKEMARLSKTEQGDVVIGPKEPITLGTSFSAHVALTREARRESHLSGERRDALTVSDNTADSLMALPILDDAEKCFGVVEFYRLAKSSHFTEEEEEIASLLLAMGTSALCKMETHSVMIRQRKLSDFLLEVTKSVFQDIVSMDVVIMKIMNFAQRLVNADRASLFLVDYYKRELYARIFDVGHSANSGGKDNTDYRRPHEEIRFSMDKGVAGYVASTGKVLNIKDAYKDPRFNPEVDIRTGYKTKSILCMPIFIRGVVIGVVQMVNKRNGTFTKADEQAFETFAIYCGLALHHAKLYEKIRRSEQKYKVALDVLSYHSQATAEEVKTLKDKPIPKSIKNITRYDFSPWAVMEDDKPVHCLYMFKILFQDIKYDLEDLMRFTLTVRKNYRSVPYHNWSHAFSVAHSMFTVLQTTQHKLSPVECISLFVSCLCHDLDHRGKTNQFMVQSCSPLAAVYSTSTMEHHHFNQTVTILQNEGHNIFKYLSSDEYKKVLGDIKQSILATDLAVFFKNKVTLHNIITNEPFCWETIHHRSTLTAVAMTACDLCAMYKPWDVQLSLVYIIMEEFWQQGDEEKRRGLVPIQMMDRDKKEELPMLEVGFIQSICIPCYELMYSVMPETQPMLTGARENLRKWKELMDSHLKKIGTNV
ncbi:probable 3',5'-cyclic phosphodiesterase pde-5 isoform X4 [Biomphalaria glabrata]|uniref:Phosphodiesterase n=1 Tax=Biomphalaria glabrata TaxID=6526 RepID=A0A9W3ABF5_BIOGL|nr:probable 3',5'-cyclic phosphodiesterase pde-5 isoform X4 [Biomphalaria glabrata]